MVNYKPVPRCFNMSQFG